MEAAFAELTIEPKLILPSRDALETLGVQTQLYARLIWAFGSSGGPRMKIEEIPLREWDDRPLDQKFLSSLPADWVDVALINVHPLSSDCARHVWGNLFRSCEHPFHPRRVSGWMKYAIKYHEGTNKKASLVSWENLAERLQWKDTDWAVIVTEVESAYVSLWGWLRLYHRFCDRWFDCAVVANDELPATIVFWETSGPIVVERRHGTLLRVQLGKAEQ